jgi:hypothetical protein
VLKFDQQYCHLVCGVKQFVIWFVFCKLYAKVAVLMYAFASNINMPYTICLLYKSNKTICMLYGKFTDNGDILVNNPNVHNLEENHGLSIMSGLQPLNTYRYKISIPQITMDLLLFTYIFSFLYHVQDYLFVLNNMMWYSRSWEH